MLRFIGIEEEVNVVSEASLATVEVLDVTFFSIFSANYRNNSVAIMKPVLIPILILIR